MRKRLHTLFAAAALLLCQAAGAAVIDGRIGALDGDGDGRAQDLKVARVAFSVSANTRVFFDSLVLEWTHDLNGDGFITGFDNYMMLFQDGRLLYQRDDSGDTYADGSESPYDTAFEWQFSDAGQYLVTLGVRGYAASDALQGYRSETAYRRLAGFEDFGAWRLGLTALSGSLGGVSEVGSAVPEPGSLGLVGAGLLGAAWLGRRRRQRQLAPA